jgi:hypothetical protein
MHLMSSRVRTLLEIISILKPRLSGATKQYLRIGPHENEVIPNSLWMWLCLLSWFCIQVATRLVRLNPPPPIFPVHMKPDLGFCQRPAFNGANQTLLTFGEVWHQCFAIYEVTRMENPVENDACILPNNR